MLGENAGKAREIASAPPAFVRSKEQFGSRMDRLDRGSDTQSSSRLLLCICCPWWTAQEYGRVDDLHHKGTGRQPMGTYAHPSYVGVSIRLITFRQHAQEGEERDGLNHDVMNAVMSYCERSHLVLSRCRRLVRSRPPAHLHGFALVDCTKCCAFFSSKMLSLRRTDIKFWRTKR